MTNVFTADFESGTLTGFTPVGTVSASTAQAHGGSYSEAFAANNAASNRIDRVFTAIPADRRMYWGGWLWLPNLPTANWIEFVYFVMQSGGVAGNIYMDGNGKICWNDPSNATVITGPLMATNTWTNIEVSLVIPSVGTTANVQMVVNGVMVGSVTAFVGATPSPVNELRHGQCNANSVGITTGYFDDLVLNDDQGSSSNSWPSGFRGIPGSRRSSVRRA